MELEHLRATSKAAQLHSKVLQERRRNAVVLVLRFLADSNYSAAYSALSQECRLSLEQVDCADNVDLMTVIQVACSHTAQHVLHCLHTACRVDKCMGAKQQRRGVCSASMQEYEEAYAARFDRKPKLVRKVSNAAPTPTPGATTGPLPPLAGAALDRMHKMASAPLRERAPSGGPMTGIGLARARRAKARQQQEAQQTGDGPAGTTAAGSPTGGRVRARLSSGHAPGSREAASEPEPLDLTIEGQHSAAAAAIAAAGSASDSDPEAFFARRLPPPVPPQFTGEARALAESIQGSIFSDNPNVRWDDVAGLPDAKRLLREAVVYPMRYPSLFTGIVAPWKGVLLYGPPGTGKTLLAKAVATECRTTFFNVSASLVVSKWRGDSEKLVRTLFELARHHAPSTVFIDELDSLMAARGGEGEHEASRRMKTELLVQMDGLARSDALVFVLAATNLPWELDQAMLRRLEKRILVGLPCAAARRALLRALLGDRVGPEVNLEELADTLDGHSGSDIALLAKEAAMRPLRRLMARLEAGGGGDVASGGAAAPGEVTAEDLAGAAAVVRSSAHLYSEKYEGFTKQFGSQV